MPVPHTPPRALQGRTWEGATATRPRDEHREVVTSVPASLWEWTVDHGTGSTPTGICGARHRAMEALSRSLVKTRGPVSGRVEPVVLVDGASGFAYERLHPALTADCERGVITWK